MVKSYNIHVISYLSSSFKEDHLQLVKYVFHHFQPDWAQNLPHSNSMHHQVHILTTSPQSCNSTNSSRINTMIKMPQSIIKMIVVYAIIAITAINILFCMLILSSWTLSIEMEQYPVFFIHPSDNQERFHHHQQQHRDYHQHQQNLLVHHDLDIVAIPVVNDTRIYRGNTANVSVQYAKTQPKTNFQQKQQSQRLQLRFDWTKLQRYSTLAKQVAVMQQNCSNTKGYFWSRNKSGLGSDLHYYSIALCNALEYSPSSHQMHKGDSGGEGIRVMTLRPWIWYSTNDCSDSNTSSSAMKCYFPESEPECEVDTIKSAAETEITSQSHAINMTRRLGGITENCSNVIESVGNNVSIVRAAMTEFLFTRVSQIVQQEGQRQLNLVFGRPDLNENHSWNNTSENGVVPKNLITVHIRWGDKGREMNLSPISKYILAIERILQERRRSRDSKVPMYKDSVEPVSSANDDDLSEVNIFLATEDPEAVMEFQKAAPKAWNIYIDQYYIENLIYRQSIGNIYNVNTMTALQSNGRTGLLALGSLLVAMEANDYVLTTGSNWSRLMNEIRINILNPRCNNCTIMIDLKRGES